MTRLSGPTSLVVKSPPFTVTQPFKPTIKQCAYFSCSLLSLYLHKTVLPIRNENSFSPSFRIKNEVMRIHMNHLSPSRKTQKRKRHKAWQKTTSHISMHRTTKKKNRPHLCLERTKLTSQTPLPCSLCLTLYSPSPKQQSHRKKKDERDAVRAQRAEETTNVRPQSQRAKTIRQYILGFEACLAQILPATDERRAAPKNLRMKKTHVSKSSVRQHINPQPSSSASQPYL